MNADLINPFITALFQLLENLNADVERGSIQGLKPPLALHGITMDIRVKGDIQGRFLISTDHNTALFLANKFSSQFGMPPSNQFGPMEKSALQEITNIIGGKAVTLLAKFRHSIDITPPTIIEGSDLEGNIVSNIVFKIPVNIKAHDKMAMDMYVDLVS
ncbi:chemotaxis protein CheX [Desulfosporosinus sp. OT]|uniref:chemotaxis protein CheX n=1 Tax=Desulfosporosinus sp. OT TaxID=913865 RepID=UPI0002239EDF|nr:chemotaxis protein CheX [Desulfosporosinus sp. OT]EGW37263.1 cheC-like family protein [Desulfosporosinus sp. OT]